MKSLRMVADPSISEIDGTFHCYATRDGWGQGLATSGTPVVWASGLWEFRIY